MMTSPRLLCSTALAVALISTGLFGPGCDRALPSKADEGLCSPSGSPSCLERGREAEKNGELDKARAFYDHGCNEGKHAESCNHLGLLFGHGLGVDTDPERAAQAYERACQGGDFQGCANQAWSLAHGRGLKADPERARALYARACEEASIPMACTALSEELVASSLPREQERGRALLEASCERRYSTACVRLGLFWDGRQDAEKAVAAYARACVLASPQGCFNLGLSAGEGKGGVHYERSCELGHAGGCYNLALTLPESEALRARILYQRACDGELAEGCYNLGLSFEEAGDTERARHFLRRACGSGYVLGCPEK